MEHKLDQPFVDSFQLLFIRIYFKFIELSHGLKKHVLDI